MVRRGSTVRVRQSACTKTLQMDMLCCPCWRDFWFARVRDGYIFGLAGTREHARRLATRFETCSRHSFLTTRSKSSCKQPVGVVRTGAALTPSFASEGFIRAAVPAGNGCPPSSQLPSASALRPAELRLRASSCDLGGEGLDRIDDRRSAG